MKKHVLLSFISLLPFVTATNAFARIGPYLGADILVEEARHEYGNQANAADSLNGTKVDGVDFGFGLNAGFRGESELGFIFAQEVFFDHLDLVTNDFNFASDQQKQDNLTINYRFGTKFKLGYQLTKKFDVIADIGVAAVDYDNRSPSTNKSYGSTKAALIYGIGAYYHLYPRLTLRAYYDYQSFRARYIDPEIKDQIQIHVARIGATLNF